MLAVLYDIHGNLPALEAVVADAREAGADRFLLGGDYAAFGAWPAATVALLETLEPVVMRATTSAGSRATTPTSRRATRSCRRRSTSSARRSPQT